MILNKLFRKRKNKFYPVIMESNIIQYDEMGYPLRLVMIDLDNGTVDHVWRDIPIEEIKDTDLELKWTKI